MTINDVILSNLFSLSIHKKAPANVKAATLFKLNELDNYLSKRLKTKLPDEWSAHYAYLLHQINTFREAPDKFVIPEALPSPPGQPIGMLGCD
jgi:hypothetical protein